MAKGARSAGRKASTEATADSNQQTDSQAETASDYTLLRESVLAYTAEQKQSFDAFMQTTWEQNQRSLDLAWVKQEEAVTDRLQKFEQLLDSRVAELAEQKVMEMLAPKLEEFRGMQEKVKQLEERLESSQQCSTSQNSPSTQEAAADGSWALMVSSQGQLASNVSRLTECKMQEQDLADREDRKKRELNAVLRNFAYEEGETAANLKEKVDMLFADKLDTAVACVDAKRMQKGRSGAAPGIVLVQFEKKEHKLTVFKARGKLAGTKIGMDDDLTRLQQQRKNAAWPAFQDYKANGVKTQWRAEKLYVKEGEHFVQHKVVTVCMI